MPLRPARWCKCSCWPPGCDPDDNRPTLRPTTSLFPNPRPGVLKHVPHLKGNRARRHGQFNRVQSQLAREGIRQRQGRMPAAERGLLRVLIVDDERDTADVMALLVGTGATTPAGLEAPPPWAWLPPDARRRAAGYRHATHGWVPGGRTLRGDARLQDCFLIAMTGYAETANRLRCREAGIDLFLIKPVESCVLETLLDLECTRLGRSRREGRERCHAQDFGSGTVGR